ncbi:restriction endonuclease subunit S [Pseudoalteromonas sp. T1lg88]|uniref:restriction endonuclease subunit S n=1 Tax=Pseudoalteromonas sp. T1lg88 TaxID=2077104 RepID=UPI000CF6FAAB|nr:restriction endonuclease subunit S [Pseudoalteromonas sp. T1lg88]
MSQLPQSWEEKSVKDINHHKGKTIKPIDFPDETFELYSVPSFSSGKPELTTGSEIGSSKQMVEPGDVLVCKINPRINRVWVVESKGEYRQIASSEWINVRNSSFDSRYLRYAFTRQAFRELICSEVSGVGGSLTRAQPKKVATYPVPVAPEPEQKRIADKLDSVLAKVESAQARLDKIPTILKRFRQSVLAAATSGEVTKDWREENGVQFNFKEYGFDEILTELRNGLSAKPNEDGKGTPILRISSVRAMEIDQQDIRYLELSDKELEKYMLCEGDLLFTRYNGSLEFVGVCGLLTKLEHENLVYPDKLIRARLNEKALPQFIEILFSSLEMRDKVTGCVKTTSGQKGISGKNLKELVVKLPGISEQKEIVRQVSNLLAKAESVEHRYLKSKVRLDSLTQSILSKAFSGKL